MKRILNSGGAYIVVELVDEIETTKAGKWKFSVRDVGE